MAQHTQKAIRQTFLNMLEDMPLDKITVSALAGRRGLKGQRNQVSEAALRHSILIGKHTVIG